MPLAVNVIGILGQNGILILFAKHPLDGMYTPACGEAREMHDVVEGVLVAVRVERMAVKGGVVWHCAC